MIFGTLLILMSISGQFASWARNRTAPLMTASATVNAEILRLRFEKVGFDPAVVAKESQSMLMPVMVLIMAPFFVWSSVLEAPTAPFSVRVRCRLLSF